jgi:hypothetical protein
MPLENGRSVRVFSQDESRFGLLDEDIGIQLEKIPRVGALLKEVGNLPDQPRLGQEYHQGVKSSRLGDGCTQKDH